MSPTDADFDDMHHALGRPDGPHVAPYRNFYCCAADGPTAQRFEQLALWAKDGTINDGRDAVYRATDAGRRQLMSWLVDRQRANGIRPWRVEVGSFDPRTVLAKSRSAARFEVYRELDDAWCFNRGFRGFLALGVKVSAA